MCCAFVLRFGGVRFIVGCVACLVLQHCTCSTIIRTYCRHKLWYGYCHSMIIVQTWYRNYILIPAVLCGRHWMLPLACSMVFGGVCWTCVRLCPLCLRLYCVHCVILHELAVDMWWHVSTNLLCQGRRNRSGRPGSCRTNNFLTNYIDSEKCTIETTAAGPIICADCDIYS